MKYNKWVNIIELVTHNKLNVDWYYIKNWYIVAKDDYIADFLSRKKINLKKKIIIFEKIKI